MIRRLILLSGLLGVLAACGGAQEPLPTAVPAAVLPQNNGVQGEAPALNGEGSGLTQPEIAQAAPGDKPSLPPLEGNAGVTSLNGGSAPVTESGDTAVGVVVADPFVNTTFTLDAELPAAPAEAPVLRQIQRDQIDPAYARKLANRFGFSGDLYQETFPTTAGLEAAAMTFAPPIIYYAFDGPRTFSIDPWSANYHDGSVTYDYQHQPDFATASQVATQFLQDRGLLDFPHALQQGFGSDVFVVRQVNGRPLNQPEIVVGISATGEVSHVSYQVMPNLETLNTYPLISADDAWARLQSGITINNIPYTLSSPANDALPAPPLSGEVQSWSYTYAPGAAVQLYGWPNAYLPASGSGTARVLLFPYLLQGDAEVINQIAETVGQQIMVEGVMGDDGQTVTVTSWAAVNDLEPLALQGIVGRDGQRMLLVATDGQTYHLPDAPAAIPDGMEVFVFAWQTRQMGDDVPALQWDRIDQVVALDETAVAEPIPVGSAAVNGAAITIKGVELAYFVTYLYPEALDGQPAAATPTVLLQPAWKFTGMLNSGQKVEFFVQAVSGEFVQP